ncbi:MAG: peptidoglycan DD-metalloendopeptidase family protein [Gemmatimonas sp.]|nr:peptidoglycan DD-metalloendopeptidase family protein [Gemmatimonas sp.]
MNTARSPELHSARPSIAWRWFGWFVVGTATVGLVMALLPSNTSSALAADEPLRVPATIRWTPTDIAEGMLFTVVIEGSDPAVRSATGSFGGEPLHFEPVEEGVLAALAAAPLDSVGARPLRVDLMLADGSREDRVVEIPVEQGTYEMQRLSVAPEFGRTQPPEIQRRIDAESDRALEVSRASHSTPQMWEPPIVAPRDSRITSGFGHGRMFNGEVQSRHTGTDFGGAVGTPVVAPARGVIALVDDFYLGGGVIYIDHGAGLVTAYLHLSEQLVSEGDIVEPGQTIGLVGATGRVTGPHLHWIVRYGPHSVDGLGLLNLPADAASP